MGILHNHRDPGFWITITKINVSGRKLLQRYQNCVKIYHSDDNKKAVTALYRPFFGYTSDRSKNEKEDIYAQQRRCSSL